MRKPSVLIGSSIPAGPNHVDIHRALKLGDLVLTAIPRCFDDAMAVARTCREKGIHLCWSEFCFRGTQIPCKAWRQPVDVDDFYTREQLDAVRAAAGPFYFGRYVIGEIGGMLYWPKDYLPGRKLGYTHMPACENHAAAAAHYISYCRDLIENERRNFGGEPLMNVESSLLFKYHAQAGLDRLCLEVMPGNPEWMHAAIRGAARAYDLEWGTHIAMGWYGGVRVDELFQNRWRVALAWSYLCGADFILPESGHYGYSNPSQGIELGFDSPEMVRMRRSLRHYVRLAHVHRRPEAGPRVRLGLLHGQFDGTPGLWNPFAWGQYHADHWKEGPAERGWQLLEKMHRREPWFNPRVQGTLDTSGNPPYGQIDIVPAEAETDVLQRYSALICLGWNTMTPELHARLLDYVRRGGRLVMFLPQLRTNADRKAEAQLFRNGDLSELFGVTVNGTDATDVRGIRFLEHSSLPGYRLPVYRERQDPVFLGDYLGADVKLKGANVLAGFARRFDDGTETVRAEPFLVEHRVGAGTAMLALAWNWPGDDAMRDVAAELLRVMSNAEQGDIALTGSDRIRYAVYHDNVPVAGQAPLSVIYLLNTDLQETARTRLRVRGEDAGPLCVDPAQLKTVFLRDDLLVIPQSPTVDVEHWKTVGTKTTVHCFSVTAQPLHIRNLADAPRTVVVNDLAFTIAPHDESLLQLDKRVDPTRARYFADNFLDEPAVDVPNTDLPY